MLIKVDFGRIFAGLVLMLVGDLLLVIWLLLALVSFFAFFFPALHGIFYLSQLILIVSLAHIAGGVLITLTGVRGWRRIGSVSGSSSDQTHYALSETRLNTKWSESDTRLGGRTLPSVGEYRPLL